MAKEGDTLSQRITWVILSRKSRSHDRLKIKIVNEKLFVFINVEHMAVS